MNNYQFPKEMIFDRQLNSEEINLLKSQYQRIINIEKEDINNNQLSLTNEGEVILLKGTLLFPIKPSVKQIKEISKRGILASEFIGEKKTNKNYFCADFYRVPNDILLSSYDSNFNYSKETPFNDINDYMAFVINPCSKIGGILYYDIYDSKFDSNITIRNIIDTKGIPKGFWQKENKEVAAILGGIPRNAISGVILGDKAILNDEILEAIETNFPLSFIVMRDGTIVKDRSNIIKINDYEKITRALAKTIVEKKILEKESQKHKEEIKNMKKNVEKIMTAIKKNISPLEQAQILINIGYKKLPKHLTDKLTEEEKSKLII